MLCTCIFICLKYAAEVLFSLVTPLAILVQTVGSLDAVNAQVADGGLRRRAPLPELVMDTAADRIIEPVMPPKRRVVAGGVSHAQAKHRPTNGGGGAKTAETLKARIATIYNYNIVII